MGESTAHREEPGLTSPGPRLPRASLTSRTGGFLLITRRLWLRLRAFSRGRGWGTASVSDQHSSSVSLSPARYPAWRRGRPGRQSRALTKLNPAGKTQPARRCHPSRDGPGSLCLLTDGWPAAGHLVLQVEGILVGRGRGIGDGAQVLHGEAAEPSGQRALTLQERESSCIPWGRGQGSQQEGASARAAAQDGQQLTYR